jgi:hypothetical protein
MSSSTYTFFDIPTKPPRECWSMNTWRSKFTGSVVVYATNVTIQLARLVLNYKGLDYKTEWVL